MSRVIFRLPPEAYINTMMGRQRRHDVIQQREFINESFSDATRNWTFATRVAAFVFEQVCLVIWGYFSFNTHASSVGRFFGLTFTTFIDFSLVITYVLSDTKPSWRPRHATLICLDLLCVPFLIWGALVIFFDTKPYDFGREPCLPGQWSMRCEKERELAVAFGPEFGLSVVVALVHTTFMVTQCIACHRRAAPARRTIESTQIRVV